MLGMVARQEVHLAIDEITITAARARVVDFTRPYFMESSACVSQAPREENQAFAVLTPFTTQVWIIIGLNVIGIGLVLFLVSSLIGQYLEVGVTFSLHDLTFNTYRSLVIQGNRLSTEEWPLRCVLLAWYFFCYYIYAVYAGRLTAVLAIPVFEKPIDTLLDVLQAAARHGLYPVVIRESSVDYMFQMATSGIYHDVGRLITGDRNYVDAPPSGVASVLEGKAAYIDARLSSEIQTIIQGRDNFFIGRQSFFPQSYGIACSKGTSHRAIFDRVLERIVEAGLVDKWKKDEIIKLGQAASLAGRLDQARRGVGPGAITIKHLQGAFFMYVLGSGVACLAFLVEKMYRSSSSILPQPGASPLSITR
ncbi:glutamate receptor ionotropic, delta-2-like [Panulirus ornatus]|uniref:glutamate receptor ionotropic, delta-2-like n=1 Tax=Panulirus ornatus TaxID=150431 RepID=UPI003A8A3155